MGLHELEVSNVVKMFLRRVQSVGLLDLTVEIRSQLHLLLSMHQSLIPRHVELRHLARLVVLPLYNYRFAICLPVCRERPPMKPC